MEDIRIGNGVKVVRPDSTPSSTTVRITERHRPLAKQEVPRLSPRQKHHAEAN
jgi:hypothetical protein